MEFWAMTDRSFQKWQWQHQKLVVLSFITLDVVSEFSD
jgi:hypothetical protein